MRKFDLNGGSISTRCRAEREQNRIATFVYNVCTGFAHLQYFFFFCKSVFDFVLNYNFLHLCIKLTHLIQLHI